MKKTVTFSDQCMKGASLAELGYRDYIAARFLLNNRFIIQGLTLASSAVEKYLKALLVITANQEEKINVHLDNIKKLKNILAKYNIDVTENFDPVFQSILEKAYKIRYYDTLKKPIFIGFFLNQFIGELDYTIDSLEKRTNINLLYTRAIRDKEPHLFKNNYILKKQSKKDFMEKPDFAFSIHIKIDSSVQTIETVMGKSGIRNKYDGCITEFKEFLTEW